MTEKIPDSVVHAVLTHVTRDILDRMERSGFRVGGVGPVRHDPLVWDINDGHCEAWAKVAADLLPGSFPAWIDADHCVLVYHGRFYDADCLEGARHWDQLPMFADPAHERPEP